MTTVQQMIQTMSEANPVETQVIVLAQENYSEWHSVLTTLFQQRPMGRILVRHMYESLLTRL